MAVNETTPLTIGVPSGPSYVNTPGENRVGRRRKRRQRPPSTSSSKMSKEGNFTNDTIFHCAEFPTQSMEETTDNKGQLGRGSGLGGLKSKLSLTLKNTGSVARDHLASERTFLAYVRTSLGIVTAGVALVQLFTSAAASHEQIGVRRLQATIRILGACTLIFGLAVLIVGIQRYFAVQSALTSGTFPAARLPALMISLALVVLTAVTFCMMLVGNLAT